MIILLDTNLSTYTNGICSHTLEASTLKAGMQELFNRYPQLLIKMTEEDYKVCTESYFEYQGTIIVSTAEADAQFVSTDVVSLVWGLPSGAKGVASAVMGFITMAVGFVLTVVGAALAIFSGGTLAVVGGWLMVAGVKMFEVGVMMVLGSLAMHLYKQWFSPTMPAAQMPELLNNSASYSFSGVKNTAVQGMPVSVVYGEHRVGGQWLNIYTRHETETLPIDGTSTLVTSNYLYGQLGLCEGEIADVRDVMVNDWPITYYDEITTSPAQDFYRLGTATQTPMPLFSEVTNTTSVGRKVTTLTSGNLSNFNVVYSDYQPLLGAIEVDNGVPSKEDLKLGRYVAVSKVTWS